VLKNYLGENIDVAAPSVPAKIIGLKASPSIGDILQAGVAKSGKVSKYQLQKQATSFITPLSRKEDEDEERNVASLNLIVKADVLGSLEAILASLEKLSSDEVRVKIINRGLGNITSADVGNASAGKASIFGFHVNADAETLDLAMEKKVEIKFFGIIYELIDEVKKRLHAMFKPDIIITDLGRLKVLAIFRKEKQAMIVGGKVTKGKVQNGCQAKVLRDKVKIGQGNITQVQQNKVEVTECKHGFECGIKYEGKPVILEGDILEFYLEEVKEKKLK